MKDVETFSISPRADIETEHVYGNVWAGAYIGENARIGFGGTIGQYVHIGPGVIVGDRCKIQNGAQLFTGVTLEDDVFIGPHVVFTNVLTPRAFVDRKTEFKPTLVKRGASIGANATILCGITIGEYAMVGAGSVVTKDVPAHALVVGNPAKYTQWVCHCGERVTQTHFARRGHPTDYGCATCKTQYVMRDNSTLLEPVDAETT